MSCHSSFSLVICFVRLPYYNSCGQQSVILFFSVLHWYFSFSLSFPVILVLIHSEGPSDEMCIKAKMYSNVHVRSPLLRERDELEGDAPVRAALCCCTVQAGWLANTSFFVSLGWRSRKRTLFYRWWYLLTAESETGRPLPIRFGAKDIVSRIKKNFFLFNFLFCYFLHFSSQHLLHRY